MTSAPPLSSPQQEAQLVSLQVFHHHIMSPPSPGSPAPQPPAPDGGWGWVIVASGFLALLLGYGSPQSMGVLYPEWLLAFGEGKSMTAWVGSLVAGVGLIVGEEFL